MCLHETHKCGQDSPHGPSGQAGFGEQLSVGSLMKTKQQKSSQDSPATARGADSSVITCSASVGSGSCCPVSNSSRHAHAGCQCRACPRPGSLVTGTWLQGDDGEASNQPQTGLPAPPPPQHWHSLAGEVNMKRYLERFPFPTENKTHNPQVLTFVSLCSS